MMHERLKLAKKLLRNDGIIFVSIDHNEHAYLKVLMDEIFGESNFICDFVWQRKNMGSAKDAKYIATLTENILMYAKNEQLLTNKINKQKFDVNDASYQFEDSHVETRGKYKLNQLDRRGLSWSENADYEFVHNGITYYAGGVDKSEWIKRKTNHNIKDWTWRWSKEKLLHGIKNDFIVFKNNKIFTKQYQFVDKDNNQIEREYNYNNLILNIYNQDANKELISIFNDQKVFSFPKPVFLIKFLINLYKDKNAKVLDFFAGSGTTGHAVEDLNRQDGGNRSYTLVTNNENNIGYEITYERLFRINNNKTSLGQSINWSNKNDPYNSNLDVFKVKYESTNLNDSRKIDQIVNDVSKMLSDFGVDKNLDFKKILNQLTSLKKLDGD